MTRNGTLNLLPGEGRIGALTYNRIPNRKFDLIRSRPIQLGVLPRRVYRIKWVVPDVCVESVWRSPPLMAPLFRWAVFTVSRFMLVLAVN